MKFSIVISALLAGATAVNWKHQSHLKRRAAEVPDGEVVIYKACNAHTPKVVIISLFEPEMEIWHEKLDFVHNITVPGLSPLFPHVFCTEDYSLCNVVTGESEINAASSIMALTTSPLFDLSKTYFLVAGIAGVNPHVGTLASAAFERFTVSAALQYELDAREIPSNWSTGYFSYGTDAPGEFPGNWYGTEVFEFNQVLRDRAYDLASNVTLKDKASAMEFRAMYNYAPANKPPSLLKCDSVTSDVYYTGALLSEAFGNTTKVWTNGTGEYCMTAQEDSAVAEAMLRASKFGLVDYSRLVVLRTASDFDQGPPGMDPVYYFTASSEGSAFETSIQNLYIAGWPFVNDVLTSWDELYANNTFAPSSYEGDVFGYLGGSPNFGPGSYITYNYI